MEPESAGLPGMSFPGMGFSKRSSFEQAVTKNRAIIKNAVSFANCAFIFFVLVVSVWFFNRLYNQYPQGKRKRWVQQFPLTKLLDIAANEVEKH
jgi:hypothetical protein